MKAIQKGIRLPNLRHQDERGHAWFEDLIAHSDADVAFSQAKIAALKAGMPMEVVL